MIHRSIQIDCSRQFAGSSTPAQLYFKGMLRALRAQQEVPNIDQMNFMGRLGLLVDHEVTTRENARLQSRLRRANLRQSVCMEDLDYRTSRGLNQPLMLHLAKCSWIRGHENVAITGPTGVGKTFVACALAHKACLLGYSVQYVRLPRLFQEFALAHAEGRSLKLLNQLARLDLLVLDDWAMKKISSAQREDLHEMLDDRMKTRSTIVASQIPIEPWHEMVANPTLSDVILDRLVHMAHRVELKGESMRKQLAKLSGPVHQNSHNHVHQKKP